MIQLLYLLILLWGRVHHHGPGNAEKATTPTTCYCAAPALATSHGLHHLEQQAYRALHSDSFITSFCRHPSPCAAQSYPSRQSQSNGGVLEMQKMLEGVEWKTPTLPPLRWTMGSCTRYFLPASRAKGARASIISRTWQVPAWEKCAMARQCSLPTKGWHTQSQKWLRTTEETQATWQEEAGKQFTAICCAIPATSVECILRPHKECAGGQRWGSDDGRRACRDDAGPQNRLQRPDRDAGQCQENGEEVRHQDNGAADQRDASNKCINWTCPEAPSPAPRCQNQTQEVMAQTSGDFDVHPGETVRSVRGPAERLPGAHSNIQERDSNIQKDNAETECSSCGSSYSRASHRGRRSDRTSSTRLRRGRTSLSSEQDAEEMSQVLSGQGHDRASVRRRRRFSDGSACVQAAKVLRTWVWRWFVLSLGSGGSSLFEIVHHVPDVNSGPSVDSLADAYRRPLETYAACQAGTDTLSCTTATDVHALPLHSVLFEQKCVHPFLALHHAYELHAQCQDESVVPLISRSCGLCSSLRKPGPKLPKKVTFSSFATLWIANEDEIGNSATTPRTMLEHTLHVWRNKPWQLRPLVPQACHFTDQHTQGAYEAYQMEFGAGERQHEPNPHDIRLQPTYIQDLEVALQQFGET